MPIECGVSIHIRHYWRMNSLNPGVIDLETAVSIHIRHYWRMNSFRWIQGVQLSRFNPHSPLLANEFLMCKRAGWPSLWSFNPHSPLLANEFAAPTWAHIVGLVSIHIRHYWRMNLAQRVGQPVFVARVSIHIRHYWRMNLVVPHHVEHLRLFQSTFAITGE